jgi:hypothetical protein
MVENLVSRGRGFVPVPGNPDGVLRADQERRTRPDLLAGGTQRAAPVAEGR